MDLSLYQVWFVNGIMYEVSASDSWHAIEVAKSENKECWYWDLLKVIRSDTNEVLIKN